MEAKAAVLRESPGTWKIEDVEIDEPQTGEVLVEMMAAGLCHSDDHFVTGDILAGAMLPFVGGHEGAGVVRRLGPGVHGLEVGDHVITSYMPACGECRSCSRGLQNLCDNGAIMMEGHQLDGTYRVRRAGKDIGSMLLLGTFAEWQIFDQKSLVKIDKEVPFDVACLVSCGVQTGFGSAVVGASVRPGDVVLVVGVGGVGMNAVQGAATAGAAHVIAIDPVEVKRKWAMDFGATDAFSSIAESLDRVQSLTNGQGADAAILTVGVLHGELLAEAYDAIAKAGTVVVTAVAPQTEVGAPISLATISMFQKRIQGACGGMTSPREAIPALLDLYKSGKLKLDELITARYSLDQINDAYDDMRAGSNIRGIIEFAGGTH